MRSDNSYSSFSVDSIGIPEQVHVRIVGKLHAIREVTVSGAVRQSA